MKIGENFERAQSIIRMTLNANAYLSYSQFGEDLLIDIIFSGKVDCGFYVDIGAHHPQRFSNTYLLYERGWSGINVDGDPDLIRDFQDVRGRDKNICSVVSDCCQDVIFTKFSEAAVNTISLDKVSEYETHWQLLSSETVRTTTLKMILDQHVPPGQQVDLFSIDVEGADLSVLRGNDWVKYRPYLIIVEADGLDLMSASSNPTVIYLLELGYRLHSLIHISAFFIRMSNE